MKFFRTGLVVFGLLGSLVSSAVIPAEKRQVAPAPDTGIPDAKTVIGIVTNLITDVKEQTSIINATTASFSSNPNFFEILAAAGTIRGSVETIIGLVNGAVVELGAAFDPQEIAASLPKPEELVGPISNLLVEIVSSLPKILSNPASSIVLSTSIFSLAKALSALIKALGPVGPILQLVTGLIQTLPLPAEAKSLLALAGIFLG